MTDHDRYIPGVPCWVQIAQPDPAAAAEFYGALFGWEVERVTPDGAEQSYRIASLKGGTVAGIAGGAATPASPAWETYVRVADADETTAKVRAAGGDVLVEPTVVGPAGRQATFADPGGAVFSAWEADRRHGADVVNEHGALNFNQLHTGDVERAAAFYGAVFGWELLGVGDASMWALAAYGDFLEQRRPGMREEMAAVGAPDRFEDVVAALVPAAGADGPDHWGVVFGADDADAIARRAAELGGTVLQEPFDAPWVRMTVVRDPQGAVFTASKFVPENRDDAVG